MNVAFINENTLGHASYLLPYVEWLRQHPALSIVPHVIHATPLPENLERRANVSVPVLRKSGLDFQNARWRRTVSAHVRRQLDELRRRVKIDAVVVNTQSVALDLVSIAEELPVLVALDATFAQLARSRWFAPNAPTRWLLPLTLSPLRGRERSLFAGAHCLLPWSASVVESLRQDYGVPPERIHPLPPSAPVMDAASVPVGRASGRRPQILFIGGDFQRKGGPLLLECFQRQFATTCDLHLVTRADLPVKPPVYVHRNIEAGTREWRQRWSEADLFVFPSTLETFGIVLLEALAFGVPVIASRVGAAEDILAGGGAGWLVPPGDGSALKTAMEAALGDPAEARRRAAIGRERSLDQYDLARNSERLAGWIRKAVESR
ncbi:MAG TPA: glycosyltransferase family 4 protein [Roseimicrobium sp.]|nr:glycosyltransferase family 4 protein [Roseimicrobium sp.]